jgi:hypothetical protein
MVGQKKVKLQRGGHRVIDWCASVLSCGTGVHLIRIGKKVELDKTLIGK